MSQFFPHLTVVGIVGKIGSGKSEVVSILSRHGFQILDCDQIVHELYQPEGWGTQKIRTFFGETYVNKKGEVSRQKLLRTLIKSPKKWEILNRMIHPLVAEMLKRKMRTFSKGKVALEIQIYTSHLFEPFIDYLWLVRAPESQRIERLQSRGLALNQIESIGRQQKEDALKADAVLENDGDQTVLSHKVEELLKSF